LVSKVKALLRRLNGRNASSSKTLNVGGIEINREEYKIVKDGREIVLTSKRI
jgi:two-component system alkaline phosphatase synthesis response regulator PhoP